MRRPLALALVWSGSLVAAMYGYLVAADVAREATVMEMVKPGDVVTVYDGDGLARNGLVLSFHAVGHGEVTLVRSGPGGPAGMRVITAAPRCASDVDRANVCWEPR